MTGSGTAQPNIPDVLVVSLKDVNVLGGGGLAPSAVLNVGETFTFKIDLGITGPLTGLLAGDNFSVTYHVETIETGERMIIPGNDLTIPAAALAGDFSQTDGPFTAGVTHLKIPEGYAAGTFRILTHIHAANPSIAPIVAAFHDGLIVMVVPQS